MTLRLGIEDRILPPPRRPLLDHGASQNDESSKLKLNKAPFLSKCPRNTQICPRLWTHAIYYADFPPKIQNCASMMSKHPRFPYEPLSKEDLEAIACRCRFQNVCECSSGEIEPTFVCQGKVPRRLFKGHPPKSSTGEELFSADGSQKKNDQCPPFYDIRVDESTDYYQGCKWSRWTSKRSTKEPEHSPGPADYSLERERTHAEDCAEKVRFHRRKRSKQPRFIEMVQQRDILEGRPGPATYSPNLPAGAGSNMQFLGSKADRFTVSATQHPGPADHWIQREFDLPIRPLQPCHARLPEPSCFGVKAKRFKPRKEEGASPATYNLGCKECFMMHCPTVPFGSSRARFKDEVKISAAAVKPLKDKSTNDTECIRATPTWEFRSKTIRIKPLQKKLYEQSPADFPQQNCKVERPRKFQYTAPFFSSEGRFQPWNDWMPIFGKYETPGPCYYNLEKLKCYPAVSRGPLVRTHRFPSVTFDTPAPNEYKVGGGLETVLGTHNQKLKQNIDTQHKFIWEPRVEPEKLSCLKKESLLLHKSIALLDAENITDAKANTDAHEKLIDNYQLKPKLLRWFLYNHPTPTCV
ncbi:Uncharacterized protein OBRU01_16572 [Operophtera brumata]|uniref:Uncharacterized protein n=1 Tax=Operophtera brumata TaxID=104452 RepID=A0A0L7KVD6_OPEBR|nr:Uncharacterized protein OBRU01_16572 [Operophtera brumata]